MKKFVIWGPKLHKDTFTYINYGFYRAIESLGYDVTWISDEDDVSSVDFTDTIFLGEFQGINKMPVLKDCIYFIHNIDCGPHKFFKYINRPVDHPNYYNYITFFDNFKDHEWPEKSTLTELEQNIFYHDDSKTIVTMWASDLLPEEIDECEPALHEENIDDIYFIGTVQGPNISEFARVCSNHGKRVLNIGGYTGQNSLHGGSPPDMNFIINAVRNSYFSFDIREQEALQKGRWYPCRIFKNISYGKWTGSNNPNLSDIFGDHFTAHSDPNTLYDKLVEDSRNCTEKKMRDAMNFIRDHHTYVNRIKNFLEIIK